MSQRFLAAVSLTGLGFDLFGGLYLAYDLLGGARGPLGIVTRAATYGLVFTIGLTIGLGFPFGTITGVGLGVLLGLEYRLHHAISLRSWRPTLGRRCACGLKR
jgi:hypothetical protein